LRRLVMRTPGLLPALLAVVTSIGPAAQLEGELVAQSRTIGRVIKAEARFETLVAPEATLEVLGEGYDWSEGPVWVARDGGFLLFSDIPPNRILKWQEGRGVSVFMQPSGYTGVADYGREPGSNGLTLDREGRLILAEHGDRRIARLEWDGGKRTLADHYRGRRLNSPNDVVVKSNSDIYFTDPIYGLPEREHDRRRELDFCGVFRWSAGTGEVTLLTKELSRPNGLAFSPDERTLYVANSDPARAIWMAYPVEADGTIGAGRLLRDVTAEVSGAMPGLPDGLKVDAMGHLFATGPGGVHVMAPDGTLLGRIETGQATSNCAFGGDDGRTLYMTADKYLVRLATRTKGSGL
jgi:gluconolactonase